MTNEQLTRLNELRDSLDQSVAMGLVTTQEADELYQREYRMQTYKFVAYDITDSKHV